MSFDPAAVRRDFPLLDPARHGGRIHYLDNAATAQVPLPVLDAVRRHETASRANVHRSVHRLAEAATRAFEGARVTMARYLNAARREEIVFTSGTTAAINLVAHSYGARMKPGDEVLVSLMEHHSNIVPWQMLRDRQGIVLKAIPVTQDGRLDLDRLDELVTERTRLIAVTHASNVTGAVTDVARVVAAARAVGAEVLLDGAQMAPHGPLDVQALGVGFYACSGHKMFGPNAIGVLWGRFDLLKSMPPFLGGGEMISHVTLEKTEYARPPMRFEAGTPPIAPAIGMAAAADWLSGQDLAGAEAHMVGLAGRLIDGLGGLDRVRVVGPSGLQQRLPVVAFTVDGVHPHDVSQLLDSRGVMVRGGHHCAEPLAEALGVCGTTRAALALYNDQADVDALLDGVRQVTKIL
ncbi:MAG: SufS family cysteine desulfurase [Pseudomonadota bacterium]|nr:SufS family cysteine desulfurase [Pseudomonadota bacterium]